MKRKCDLSKYSLITNADTCKDQCKTSGVISLEDTVGGPTCDHEGKGEPLLHRLAVHLAGQGGKAHILLVLVLLGTHSPFIPRRDGRTNTGTAATIPLFCFC